MRFVDVTINGIVHNVQSNDFRFKTNVPETTNISYPNNLVGLTNLGQALSYLDNLSSGPGGSSSDLTNVIKNINDSTVFYEGTDSTSHNFEHGLNTDIFKFDVWVKEVVGWQNSIAAMTIIDNNNVLVELPIAKQCRIILQDISDITKTYNII